ncbi:hypothetical protein OZX67_01850 [Bifidobacterium sp. ESL0728]|uniref:hypothetical protein n=1 Tax=Bifidobacterium sp. ESL0728 TaxID=2983220 RepID=UPI0023F792EE|nr:hypothetical protein [Bifidobacterium sp. ESL0728]WEV59335.1 hypothetical protein OZX67_01850 [Bifidobacterium sp. ESL0728]
MNAINDQTTMVANFDSMEQLKQWMRIAGDLKIWANGVPKAENRSDGVSRAGGEGGAARKDAAEVSSRFLQPGVNPTTGGPAQPASLSDGLWAQSSVKNNCESLLNTYPQFASCFAGIIRTAYLYAPKIVVTVADLFDGVFFVALGPKAVNGILGTSYKDGAKLVVSGWEATLEENLVSFVLDKDRERVNEKTYCTLDGRLLGVGKLEQASLGWGTHLASTALGNLWYQKERIQKAFQSEQTRSAGTGVARPLVDVLMQALYQQRFDELIRCGIPDDEVDAVSSTATMMRFSEFLARRWQEWLDAEKRGEISYQQQKNHEFSERFKNVIQSTPVQKAVDGFVYDADSYEDPSVELPVLSEDAKKRKAATDEIASYDHKRRRAMVARMVVENNMCKRSEALEFFKDVYENSGGVKNGKDEEDKREEHKWFEGWYEYIYQKAMADHIGECLKADAEEARKLVRNGRENDDPGGAARESNGLPATQECKENQSEEGFCNLIYVSNREERSKEQDLSFVKKVWKNIKRAASAAWRWVKRVLKWKEIPKDIDSDDLDGQIFVENCFLDRVRELARVASKNMGKNRNAKKGEEDKKDKTDGIHTLFGPVTDTLRHMPHSKFQTFCYESRGAIERWRLDGTDKDNTRDVGYCIMQAGSQHTLSSQDAGLKEDTALALVLALVAVLIDLVLPGNALPLVLMVLLSWIISTLPSLITLHRWKKEVQSSGQTVLIDG